MTDQTTVLCPNCLHEIILINWMFGVRWKVICDKCCHEWEPKGGTGL